MILAGFQEYYWEILLERVRANQIQFSEEIDICVCVPKGGENTCNLKQFCKNYNWSFLQLEEDLLAQAQNVAIRLHPKAEWIYKIDEDIVLSDNYFSKLKQAYQSFNNNSYLKIGFCAPMININAYGANLFLKTMNLQKDYEKLFGRYAIPENWQNAKIHNDSNVAEWIWTHSIPFDKVANFIEKKNRGFVSICPHRFSIGAILIKRDYWEKIGGFLVGVIGEMGLEEKILCEFCMNDMHAIVVAEDVFVGHLGFYRQKETIRKFFDRNSDSIKRII